MQTPNTNVIQQATADVVATAVFFCEKDKVIRKISDMSKLWYNKYQHSWIVLILCVWTSRIENYSNFQTVDKWEQLLL